MANLLAPPRGDDGTRIPRAVVWCRWVDSAAEVKRRGAVVKTEGRNAVQNPFLSIANKCLLQMVQLESESLVCRHPPGPGFGPPRVSSSRLHFHRLGFIA